MPKALKKLGIAILLIGVALSLAMLFYRYPVATQVPYQVQVPYEAEVPYQVEVAYNDTVTQAQTLDHRENYQIQTGHYSNSHFDLESGKTLVVTWQVDNTVSVYVTTSSQFDSASLLGFPTSSLARKVATSSGNLSYQVPNAGTYYVIITPYLNDVNVASYKSELQWQEQVTKYRNETRYRNETQYRTETQYKTESVYTSSTFGVNLGISVLVLGAFLTILSFLNLKSLRLKTERLNRNTCDYCGTIYKRDLDKCPHCGARKKADS
jgi:hypothetical protein